MREHTVMPGDTLASLSQHYYKSPNYGLVIWQHNRDLLPTYNGPLPAATQICIPHIPIGSRNLD